MVFDGSPIRVFDNGGYMLNGWTKDANLLLLVTWR
jgi:hypothetical protein